MTNGHSDAPKFRGFRSPNYTQVPDELFDELLPDLSGAELKVLLYIMRRTFGFKKESDSISLSQITRGIETRNGEILDRGTGLSKASVATAVKSLEARGIIVRVRQRSNHKGDEPTTYSLNILPVSKNQTPPGLKIGHPPVQELDTQETVKQQTDQDSSSLRKTSVVKKQVYDEARLTLIEYVSDLSSEFVDTASVTSSTTRAVNLYRKSGISLEEFIDVMTEARAITKERIASIKKRNAEGDKSKMAYYFAILEDLIEHEE